MRYAFYVFVKTITNFAMHMERYSVSFHIQSKFRKIRTRKTSNTDTFRAVQAYVFRERQLLKYSYALYFLYFH